MVTERYMINQACDVQRLRTEMAEHISMTNATLNTLYLDLVGQIKQPDKQQFISLLVKQMQDVHILHDALYAQHNPGPEKNVFVLNADAKPAELQSEFMSLIYSLNSICLVAYDLLLDEINEHLLNTFSVLVRSARKMVQLAEQLNLQLEAEIA